MKKSIFTTKCFRIDVMKFSSSTANYLAVDHTYNGTAIDVLVALVENDNLVEYTLSEGSTPEIEDLKKLVHNYLQL